ncbi:hypothetical protein FUSO7_03935 [Fusobacterium necrophorum BFTR-2]|nr:class I adenylate-forming enzyme family protein [Fusobacterium necrophorum]KDE74251.1 hypothetical protein FUSO7_03935 [Fusobacterium necrophorum BFTR-2]
MNCNLLKSENFNMSYFEMKEYVNMLAYYLRNTNLSLSDSICVFTQDSILDIIVLFALNKIGKNAILIERDSTWEELIRRGKLAESNTIIVNDRKKIIKRKEEFNIINIGNDEFLGKQLVQDDSIYKENIDSSCAIICTSGSTSLPKLVYKQNKIMKKHACLLKETYELCDRDTVLIIVPCQHAYGLEHFLAAFESGANIIVQNEFNVEEIIELIENDTISVLVATPYHYMFIDRLIKNKLNTNKLRLFLTAGAPMDEKISLSIIEKSKAQIIQVYGSTEISAAITNKNSKIHNSIGKPLDGIECILKKIGNNQNELLIRSPFIAEKIIDGKNIIIYDKEDWISTNDLASIDCEGNIFILGRKDNIINFAGKKINPEEVEKVIMRFYNIKDCIVYEKEKNIVADIVLDKNVVFNSTNLVNHCKKYLQNYKIPTNFFITKSIIRTKTGKIERRKK